MRRKLSILLSIMLLAAFALNGCGKSGSVLDQAAWRDDTVPSDGIVYIEPEMVSLAAELSGTSASQAASKAAFELANQQRTAAGLSALTWNSGLEQASAVRAVEASQSFSHTRPDGSDWWTVNSMVRILQKVMTLLMQQYRPGWHHRHIRQTLWMQNLPPEQLQFM